MAIINTELDIVGLGFRTKRDARRALADRIERLGPIKGMHFEREPSNPKDANAIRVHLPKSVLGGLHIGFLRASAAERLAPLMDAGDLEIDGGTLVSLNAENDYGDGVMEVRLKDNRRSSNRSTKPKKGAKPA